MKNEINAMGLACPLPVIETKKYVESMTTTGEVTVRVDNEIAVENLKKFAKSKGFDAKSETVSENEYVVIIDVNSLIEEADKGDDNPSCDMDYVAVISSEFMGIGDDKLGKNLMKAFIFSLTQQDVLPGGVICYNGGVKWTTKGSEAIEDFKMLENNGVKIVSCGTCLDFYGLKEDLAVGEVTNMYEIVKLQSEARNVIRP